MHFQSIVDEHLASHFCPAWPNLSHEVIENDAVDDVAGMLLAAGESDDVEHPPTTRAEPHNATATIHFFIG